MKLDLDFRDFRSSSQPVPHECVGDFNGPVLQPVVEGTRMGGVGEHPVVEQPEVHSNLALGIQEKGRFDPRVHQSPKEVLSQ